MLLLTLFVTVLFAFIATAIMGYISMTTAIGPWIETTLVLVGMLIFSWYPARSKVKALGLSAASGGIAGILATACGFTFPTLYFLDPEGFAALLSNRWEFAGLLSLLALSAGSFGLVIANCFEYTLIEQQKLAFPIGELVYKMITVADDLSKAVQLAIGFVGTQLFLALRSVQTIIPEPLNLLDRRSFGILTIPRVSIPFSLLPLFWAVGFVTGHVIAVPLLVGMLSRIFVIEPLHYVYPHIISSFSWIGGGTFFSPDLSLGDFTIAFASGLVLYGAAKGFLGLPKVLRSTYNKLFHAKDRSVDDSSVDDSSVGDSSADGTESKAPQFSWYSAAGVFLGSVVLLSYLEFSWLAQLYLLVFTVVCTYQLMLLAGKFGLAPLGRFATFVMVPGMLLFGYSPLQTTCVALYVEIAGGVACDALFGRKMAHMASIDKRSIVGYQWLGLLVSALAVGGIFWVFIQHFGLGNQVGALPATRAAGRALLISVKSFDVGALLLGLLYAYVISYFRISAALLLGGILMPVSYTLMLVLGGFSTYVVQDKQEYYPFWSGVFAANSLWMLLSAFI